MQVRSLALLALSAAAATTAAASLTSSAAATDSTPLPSLVAELPTCALGCFSSAAAGIGCAASDLQCLCGNATALVSQLGPCVLLSSCSSSDISRAEALAQQICAGVSAAAPSALASASAVVTSVLGAASATSSPHPNAAPPRDGGVSPAGLGLAALLGVLAAAL